MKRPPLQAAFPRQVNVAQQPLQGLSTTVSATTANANAASSVAANISTMMPAYDHPSVGAGIRGPISTLDSGECARYIV